MQYMNEYSRNDFKSLENVPNQMRSPVLKPITMSRLVKLAVCLFTSWQVGYAENVILARGSCSTSS